MKRSDISTLLPLLAMPVIMILLGLILLVFPDSAAVLISSVLAWILLLCGAGYGILAFAGKRQKRGIRILTAAFCLLLGSHLLTSPLLLAQNIGRVLGIVMALEGIQNLMKHSVSKAMALLTLLGAAVLLGAPLTASRLVFSLCGLILVLIGGAQLMERLRRRRLSGKSRKDDIIDAL